LPKHYSYFRSIIIPFVESVLKHQQNATESEIIEQIKGILKYAPDRAGTGGGGRKSAS
jgi:hypothetical protein